MKSYCIPKERVVYEVLNTEVIIVDFSTGNYFALIHVAKQIWQLIEQRASVEQIERLLSERYKREVAADLQAFLNKLLENGLIQYEEQAPAEEPILSPSEGWEYDIPELQKYTDVQSLLLLDPIHEVSEVGWPTKSD
jgi:coenzyme PQQ synthesis protein D (PqqD)